MTKCLGCGIELQYTDPKRVGYSPKKDSSYCERCFRLKNYNEYKEVELENINARILERLNSEKLFTIFLLDLLNINNETINTFKKIKAPKILVISKKDIIPKSIREENISSFIHKNYDINEDIYYLSSRKKYNIDKIIALIKNSNGKKAFIVGYTNSGKSTFINTITNKIEGTSNITTSSIPNTTLDFLNIKIDDLTLIDTPGFILNNNLYKKDEYELIKRTNPKSFIKPLTYQTKDNTGLVIENRIYLSPHNVNSLTFYISNNLIIEKVFEDKLLDKENKVLNIPNNTDVVIKGVGFVNIKKACQLHINTSYQDLIEVRQSLFSKEK